MEKTIKELAQEVYNARGTPHILAELHITLATMYASMNEDWVEIQLNKADFWQEKDYSIEDGSDGNKYQVKREKPLSDKQVEMMWMQTPEGKEEIRKKYGLRSLEKLMAAVKSSLVNATIEARNI